MRDRRIVSTDYLSLKVRELPAGSRQTIIFAEFSGNGKARRPGSGPHWNNPKDGKQHRSSCLQNARNMLLSMFLLPFFPPSAVRQLPRGDQILYAPEPIRNASGHCWRYAEGTMNLDEVAGENSSAPWRAARFSRQPFQNQSNLLPAVIRDQGDLVIPGAHSQGIILNSENQPSNLSRDPIS
jgi:hypothetical protein